MGICVSQTHPCFAFWESLGLNKNSKFVKGGGPPRITFAMGLKRNSSCKESWVHFITTKHPQNSPSCYEEVEIVKYWQMTDGRRINKNNAWTQIVYLGIRLRCELCDIYVAHKLYHVVVEQVNLATYMRQNNTNLMESERVIDTKQNRSTEGCSKLKRFVDMTSSGMNCLNIRTNSSPICDRTRCPEE